MKYLYVIFLSLVMCVSAHAQNLDYFSEFVPATNEDCPMDLGNGMIFQSVAFDKATKTVTMNYLIDKSTIESLKGHSDILHDAIVADFSTDPSQAALRNACIKADVKIVHVLSDGNNTIKVVVTPDDMK